MRGWAATLLVCAGLVAVHAQDGADGFPCPSDLANSEPLAGGYETVSFNDLSKGGVDNLFILANMSFTEWLTKDDNATLCTAGNLIYHEIELGQACTQVVQGTNTAIQFQVTFGCLADNSNELVRDQLVLDAIVYTPLPSDGNDTPQVQEVYPDPKYLKVEIVAELSPASAPTPEAPIPGFTAASPPQIKTFSSLND